MAEPRHPGTAHPPTATGEPDPRSTTEVLRSLVANSQVLVRKEIELAKLELTEIVVARLTAAALALGAAVLGLFILGFVGVTAAKGLEEVVAPWLAWLIVTAAYILVAVVLMLIAYRKATRPPNVPGRTKASAEETVQWARDRLGVTPADREVAP